MPKCNAPISRPSFEVLYMYAVLYQHLPTDNYVCPRATREYYNVIAFPQGTKRVAKSNIVDLETCHFVYNETQIA